MAARAHIPLLVATLALAAGPASAKVYLEWKPRMSLLAGYNDNVLFDGSGGDGFGQARPGVHLDIFGDHQMHVALDCQAGIGHLLHPDRFAVEGGAFASSEQCILNYKDRYSARTTSHLFFRTSYAQDPFAISGLGLLLRAGQTQVFSTRLNGEVDHAVSPRAQWQFGIDSQVLAFGTNDPANGAVFTPSLGYSYRLTPYDTVTITGREQLFYSFGASPQAAAPRGVASGIINQGHSALITWERRLEHTVTMKLTGGPLYVTGANGSAFSPTARLEIQSYGRDLAARLLLSHDLIIGASRAGALVGDLAEVGALANFGDFSGGLRLGVYRNAEIPTQFRDLGAMGYSGEVDLDYHLTHEWSIGVAALRDAQLFYPNGALQADRDVVQMRLTWEKFRPF
ncbi:MAG TPA: hypothetical protein VG496_08735 [Myxococcales bacterium]|nr:hypothetical protein [Myxococcales bacterium]